MILAQRHPHQPLEGYKSQRVTIYTPSHLIPTGAGADAWRTVGESQGLYARTSKAWGLHWACVAEDNEEKDNRRRSTLVRVIVDMIDIIQRMVQFSFFKDQMGSPALVTDTTE